jgi:hypothetical protein
LSRWHGRQAAAEDQLGVHQLIERALQTILVQATHGSQQIVRELTPDCGTDLGHLLDRRKTIQARHQRILEGRGNRQRRQGAFELPVITGVSQQTGFQHRLGQLLDEQRHAVGLGHDLRGHLCRQGLGSDNLLDHG